MLKSGIRQFLSDHPKLVSILFTLLLYLSQAGTVLANGGSGHSGP